MSNYIKLTLAIMLSISVTSQVQAKNSEHNQNRQHQRPSFESIDTNSDGEVNFEEFSSHKIPHGDPQTIFDSIDTDSNGIISNEEFTNHKPPQRRKN